jgi:hypothetical protein
VSEYVVLVAGALFASIISGATGFGFALTATAVWMQWLPPQVVAVLCVAFGLMLNIGYLPYFWREIDPKRLWPFIAGGVVGVPLGVYALRDLAPATLRMAVGSVLIVYALYAILRGRLPSPKLAPAHGQALDGGVGFAGGFFGGIGGLCGFLPALWCGVRGWSKTEQRGTVQAYILAINVVSLAWLGGVLGFGGATGHYLLVALPAVALGGVIGLKVFSRFDTAAFNRAVLWTLLAAGILLVFNSR